MVLSDVIGRLNESIYLPFIIILFFFYILYLYEIRTKMNENRTVMHGKCTFLSEICTISILMQKHVFYVF